MRPVRLTSFFIVVGLLSSCAPVPVVRISPVYLTISTEPSGARVYEEGNLLGNSPLTLEVGYPADKSRSYTAVKEGYRSQTKIFQAPWGAGTSGTMNLSMLLLLEPLDAKPQQQQQQQQQTTVVMPGGVAGGGAARAFGTLVIITTPAQAEIYIDGTFVATTPASNLQIEAGPHKIEIQKNGYKTWSRTMQVLANSPVKIEIEMEKNSPIS